MIRGCVIDDLARFSRAISEGVALLTELSEGCVDPTLPNLAKT